MTVALWYLMPLLYLCSACFLGVIPGVLVLAYCVRKSRPQASRLLGVSWLIGIVGLLPGLVHATYHQYACFDYVCAEDALQTWGWPMDWLGYHHYGNVLAPAWALVDIMVVASLAAIVLAVAFRRLQRITRPRVRTGVFLGLLGLVVLLPLWGAWIAGLIFRGSPGG